MQGNAEIVELLNEVLTAELTAVNQYFLHAKMMDNWGYGRLASHTKARVDRRDEARRAWSPIGSCTSRASPTTSATTRCASARTVPEQFQSDLRLEYDAVERLNRGIAKAVEVGDNGTRELLEGILVSEEEHVDWLETQLETIRQIGAENYLAQQLYD